LRYDVLAAQAGHGMFESIHREGEMPSKLHEAELDLRKRVPRFAECVERARLA
jgi:hypothetical protein